MRLPDRLKRKRMGVQAPLQKIWPRHRRWVRSYFCCVPDCHAESVDFAHLRSAANAGKGQRPRDIFGIGLCRLHHDEQHRIGRDAFGDKYGIDLWALATEFARRSPDWEMRASLKLVRARQISRDESTVRRGEQTLCGRCIAAIRMRGNAPAEQVVAFYNQRGTCERFIKEGTSAIKWTRLSCRTFAANAVRLRLHVLANNLGNFMRTLAMPKTAEPWSLTSLREKLIKIGAKVVSQGRYVTFHMAEVAAPRQMFQEILSMIARLRAPPAPA